MRKVLVIAYIFPPLGGSGVQRTVKFVKYLPEFGWQPIVLTVSDSTSDVVDHSLLEELPSDLPVYRAPDVNLVHLLRRTVGKLTSTRSQRPAETRSDSLQSSFYVSPLRQAWRNLVETWLMIPDPCIYWFPAALWVGLRIAKQCDIIYSTSDPFTDHLVAYFLHKLSGKPWIADFRDPWTQYVVYQQSSRLRFWIDARLEEWFLKTPDKISVTCAATASSFRAAYPDLSQDKLIEITNGFDAHDFQQLACSHFDRFTITYTGLFDGKKNTCSLFFQALEELCNKCPELASEIQVIFAGKLGEQIYDLLKQRNLQNMVKSLGYVSHKDSIKLLLRSHVLLLTLNDEPGVNLTYPGKLFEYLAARKTILALVPEGATADLIRDMGAGLAIPPTDVEAIKQAILDLYNQYKQGKTLSRTYDNLEEFERRTLTRRLAQCLDAMLQKQEKR